MHRRRPPRAALLPAAVVAAALTTGALIGPAAQAAPAPAPGAGPVVIVHVASPAAVTTALSRAHTQPGVTVRQDLAALSSFSVRVPAAGARGAEARLAALPGVTSVERPVLRRLTGVTPDDPDLTHELRYLDAIHAPAAWHGQQGSSAVRIAVVDSGVDVTHEDLAGKIAGTYNAVTHGTSVKDAVGHGTFVAGVAAASTDNGRGIAGAGYDTGLLAVKVTDSDGYVSIDDEAAGIKWAATHGADVINLSLGGPEPSSIERSAIAYAQRRGVLVVAAAGNDGTTTRQYPAAYPGVIAVGATDPAKQTRASFSQHGSWVTVAAPGVGIYSTVPKGRTDDFTSSSGYDSGDGTSFSSPLVAAEAALLKAQNPAAGATALRAAVVASAHGYAHLGLGAGQVDFARGLTHVPPASRPGALTVTGDADRISVTTTTTAPAVSFRLGDGAYGRPVTAVDGRATGTLASWGYANGPQPVYARDCTAYAECGTSRARAQVVLANAAGEITAPPAASRVTGYFTVRATRPGGGALRLLIDGKAAGTDRSAPYAFRYSASRLGDGRHTAQVQLCSTDGRRCAGPISQAQQLTAAGLHPVLHAPAPRTFSPNHDGSKDTTTLAFTLPDRESAQVRVYDAAGRLRRSTGLGTLGRGAHTWVWNGRGRGGARLPDGRYQLVLVTARGTRAGWATTTATLDTVAPSLSRPSGAGSRVYPYRDGYRDDFRPVTTIGDGGTLTLTVTDAHGHRVRTLHATRSRGRASITWNGRTGSGRLVPAGTYHWTLAVTDAAGNTRRSASYAVHVSAKRLVHTTLRLSRIGTAATAAGGTASCAVVAHRWSIFRHGLVLRNGCPAAGYDLAQAQYSFTLPSAVRYGTLTVRAYGYAWQRPSELTATVQRADGDLAVPGYVKIDSRVPRWHTLATMPATPQVLAGRHVHVTVSLDSYYRYRNDFDLATLRLLVTADVLR